MGAKENLKAIHTMEGLTLRNAYDTAAVRGVDLGSLVFATGEIVMGDPERRYGMEDYKRKTFSEKVEPGAYPLIVYMAKTAKEDRIAFAEVRFSNKKPVRYVAAKSVYDVENNRKGACSYVVNDSQTGFMDGDIFKAICALPKRGNPSSVVCFDYFDDMVDERLLETAEELPYALGYSKDGTPSAVRLKAPSGKYYWYWGKDSSGRICCLVADFFSYL